MKKSKELENQWLDFRPDRPVKKLAELKAEATEIANLIQALEDDYTYKSREYNAMLDKRSHFFQQQGGYLPSFYKPDQVERYQRERQEMEEAEDRFGNVHNEKREFLKNKSESLCQEIERYVSFEEQKNALYVAFVQQERRERDDQEKRTQEEQEAKE